MYTGFLLSVFGINEGRCLENTVFRMNRIRKNSTLDVKIIITKLQEKEGRRHTRGLPEGRLKKRRENTSI